MHRMFVLCTALLCCAGATHAQPTTRPRGQQFCLPETDPASPRKSKLVSKTDDNLRFDLDNDGDPDVLEVWWNGKRARWIDENDDLKPADARGDNGADSVQIDYDGDGYYDGPSDMAIKWVDDNADGLADAQIIAVNPSRNQRALHGDFSHYMVFVDIDKDGVNAFIDFNTFDWVKPSISNWRITGKGNYSPDYNGDSIFLKQHEAPWAITNPRLNWENPFAFYDFDKDGCTEMAIRFLDIAAGPEGKKTYPGQLTDAFVTYDLDNDSQKDNEFDFDMSLRFTSADTNHPGERFDYSAFSDKHNIRAPQWVLYAGLYRYDNYRRIDDWCYVTHDKCYEVIWPVKWGQCWFVFDEDDDDHRWERVEMYYPPGDIYSTKRWQGQPRRERSISGHNQADSIGDRAEWDYDNSGRGKLYIGKFDGRLHLFGAEHGAWLPDAGGKYWGAGPVIVGGSSRDNAAKPQAVVQYRDSDGNGFIDEITFDDDADKKIDLAISLLEFSDDKNPNPDVAQKVDPATLKWQGLHELHIKMANESFQQGQMLYRAAWKAGLTTPELDDLAFATSTGEKYDHGYALKQTIFRALDARTSGEQRTKLRKAFFTGDYAAVALIIGELPPK